MSIHDSQEERAIQAIRATFQHLQQARAELHRVEESSIRTKIIVDLGNVENELEDLICQINNLFDHL
jgi:hypothetical protein